MKQLVHGGSYTRPYWELLPFRLHEPFPRLPYNQVRVVFHKEWPSLLWRQRLQFRGVHYWVLQCQLHQYHRDQ